MINVFEYPLHKLMATTKDADLGRCKVRRCVHTRLLQRAHVARRALHNDNAHAAADAADEQQVYAGAPGTDRRQGQVRAPDHPFNGSRNGGFILSLGIPPPHANFQIFDDIFSYAAVSSPVSFRVPHALVSHVSHDAGRDTGMDKPHYTGRRPTAMLPP